MSEQTTFASLKLDVQRYIERGFSAESDPLVYAQIPRLINAAERRCARELKIEGFINVVTTTLASGVSVYEKPTRWRRTISFNIGASAVSRKFIYPRSYEYVRKYWPDESLTGTPEFYADYNFDNWVIAPTPDQQLNAEILYWQTLPLLDDQTQSNWLTQHAPDLLLYATLLEAAPFLKNSESMAIWQQFFDRHLAATNGEDVQRMMDRTTVRKEA
jgi:hypothetical protein